MHIVHTTPHTARTTARTPGTPPRTPARTSARVGCACVCACVCVWLLQVRALDQFGNVDESFERDVTLAADGPQGSDFNLPNDGVVRLSRGLAKLRVQRADYVARLNANADSPTRVPRSPRAPNQGLDLS